jgi:crotonobetainyl-CoA:carnitine CoA-transferase CaiB-like acyl-CoA transferase
MGSDGKSLTIGLLDPKWWPALCRTLEREDLLTDERFVTPRNRFQNREALVQELERAFGCKPRDEWLRLLKEADVPCGPVNSYADVATDPQVLANRYITELEHPSLGPIRVVGSPIRMSATPTGPRAPAPELGQHTEDILLGLGYTWDDIARLKEEEVV